MRHRYQPTTFIYDDTLTTSPESRKYLYERYTYDDDGSPDTAFRPLDHSFYPYGWAGQPVLLRASSMYDEVDMPSKRYAQHECDHETMDYIAIYRNGRHHYLRSNPNKFTTSAFPFGEAPDIAFATGYVMVPMNHEFWIAESRRLNGMPPLGKLIDTYVRKIDFQGITDRKYTAWKPSLKGSFSLPNFLVELVELKALFKSIKGYHSLFNKLKRLLRRGGTAREVAKLIGEYHLTWAFGFAPLFRDICSIITILSTWQERADELWANAGKPVSAHLGRELLPDIELPSGGIINQSYSPLFCPLRVKYEYRAPTAPVLHSTVFYRYHVPEFRGLWTRILQFCNSFGISFNLSAVWDAIPFSFVVDWVFHVGERLEAFDIDNIKITIALDDCLTSVKSVLERRWYLLNGWDPFPFERTYSPSGQVIAYSGMKELEPTYIGSDVAARYIRLRVTPKKLNKLTVSAPGLREVLLSASLLATRGTIPRPIPRYGD